MSRCDLHTDIISDFVYPRPHHGNNMNLSPVRQANEVTHFASHVAAVNDSSFKRVGVLLGGKFVRQEHVESLRTYDEFNIVSFLESALIDRQQFLTRLDLNGNVLSVYADDSSGYEV